MSDTVRAPLRLLLRGEAAELASALREPATLGRLLPLLLAILLGSGAYGAGIGLWRHEMHAVYVAVKMPLLVLSTLVITGVLNGMLAQVLGSGLSFAQSLKASLMCFALFSLIVGALSPVVIFMVLQAPSPLTQSGAEWYRGFLLANTVLIAFAGIVANARLLSTLHAFAQDAVVAWNTLVAWLLGNLFVGAQLSYNLRPFFSNPDYVVEFLRPEPFDGTFYQVAWGIAVAATGSVSSAASLLLVLLIALSSALLLWRAQLLTSHPPHKP